MKIFPRVLFHSVLTVACWSSLAYSLTTVNVSTLSELISALTQSDQHIYMAPGNYLITDLPSASRSFICSGSNNIIEMTGVYINFPVGSTDLDHFIISGSNNTLRGGNFEDTYKNGLTEITDFSAYNQDRTNLAYGSRPTLTFTGSYNRAVGVKMTVRGSFPYGYGSMYGINADNTFGIKKRAGIQVTGPHTTIDSCEVQILAFGHGIYIQAPSDSTVIMNTLVEGRVRSGADMYNDSNSFDLPFKTNFEFAVEGTGLDLPYVSSYAIPRDQMYSLSEDGIRVYSGGGSIIVENSTVKKTRGGIRLYLGGTAVVHNSTAIDCESTNFNLPTGGVITGSFGNFAYGPLNDFRTSKSNQNVELTILPSPNATGPHNIADIQGNSHTIVFHRSPGPLDTTTRAIVVYGNKSTINNETEYAIILDSGTSGNKVISCGPVTDNGTNTITLKSNCSFAEGPTRIQASLWNASAPTQIAVYSITGRLLARGTNRQETIARANQDLSGRHYLIVVNTVQGRKSSTSIVLGNVF